MDDHTKEKINDYIQRIKDGDSSAIEHLHSAIAVRLRFIALKYFGYSFTTDDIIQDFWLNIEKFCRKYRYVGNGYNYLMRIFDNFCKERYKIEHRKGSIISLEVINEFEEDLSVNGDLTIRRIALRQSFEKAKGRMNDTEKLVFAMILYGEMSVRDIAKATGFSKSKVQRIRQSCMDILKETLIDDGWDNNDGRAIIYYGGEL